MGTCRESPDHIPAAWRQRGLGFGELGDGEREVAPREGNLTASEREHPIVDGGGQGIGQRGEGGENLVRLFGLL